MKKISVVLFLLLTGCAGSGPTNIALTKPNADRVKPVHVHAAVTADLTALEATAPLDTSAAHASAASTGNPAADILGHVIAEALIRGTHTGTRRINDPLLSFTSKFDFAGPFTDRFRQAVKSSDWLKVTGITTYAESLSDENRQGIVSKLGQESALLCDTSYSFSSDYRRLYVRTAVELWTDASNEAPVYRAHYVFASSPVADETESLETALNRWSAHHEVLFRKVLAQGIEEDVALLTRGILKRDVVDATATTPTTIVIDDDPGKPVSVQGTVLSQDRFRLIVRSAEGDYYSLGNPERKRAESEAYVDQAYRAEAIKVKLQQQQARGGK
jgi:hypothetical protein